MIRDIETKVFKNHHGTWSYLVEACTDDGCWMTFKGRELNRFGAQQAARKAELAMLQALRVLA